MSSELISVRTSQGVNFQTIATNPKLSRDVCVHIAQYVVQTGKGTLFQENNLAFFATCKKFRATRQNAFRGNTQAVFDIFMKAKYRVSNIPQNFLQLLQSIAPSIIALPFKMCCDFQKTLTLFPDLKEVRFSKRPAAQTSVSLFERMNKETCLTVTISEEEITLLADRTLSVFEIESTNLTHSQLVKALKSSKESLQEIALHGCMITDDTFHYLSENHPHLEKIFFTPSNGNITDKGLSALAKLVHLKTLSIFDTISRASQCNVTEKSVQKIASHCPIESLELHLETCESVDAVLPYLAHFKKLSSLRLICGFSKAGQKEQAQSLDPYLSTIANISTLTALELYSDYSFTQERIDELASLTNLREFGCVFFPETRIFSKPPRFLSQFAHLQKFMALIGQVTPKICKTLRSLPQFQELELSLVSNLTTSYETEQELINVVEKVKPRILTLLESANPSFLRNLLTTCQPLEQLRFVSRGSGKDNLQNEREIWRDVKKTQDDFPHTQLYCNRELVAHKTYVQPVTVDYDLENEGALVMESLTIVE